MSKSKSIQDNQSLLGIPHWLKKKVEQSKKEKDWSKEWEKFKLAHVELMDRLAEQSNPNSPEEKCLPCCIHKDTLFAEGCAELYPNSCHKHWVEPKTEDTGEYRLFKSCKEHQWVRVGLGHSCCKNCMSHMYHTFTAEQFAGIQPIEASYVSSTVSKEDKLLHSESEKLSQDWEDYTPESFRDYLYIDLNLKSKEILEIMTRARALIESSNRRLIERIIKEIDELEQDYLSGPGLSDKTKDGLDRLRGRILEELKEAGDE